MMNFMSIIISIFVGLATILLVAAAKQLTATGGRFTYDVEDENGTLTKKFAGLNQVDDSWVNGAVAGVLTGLVCYFAPIAAKSAELVALAPIFLAVMVALSIMLMVWWKREGGEFVEMIPFVLLGILFFFVTASAAYATAAWISNAFWKSVIRVIPPIMLIATEGFYVIDYLWFRYHEIDVDESSCNRDAILGWLAIAATTALIAFFLVTGIAWGKAGEAFSGDKSVETASATQGTNNSWVHYFNLDLLNNGNADDDFNFGPNPYKDNEAKDAKYYDTEFRERLKRDPALTAADTAWLDANVGTRYLGEFYESCQHDWARTMNDAKDRFSTDQSAYYKNLDAFFKYLDTAEVELRECHGVSDQMYMNPYTPSGNPDIIVMRTDDHSGWELVYKFKIKDNVKEVAYRIPCGYQPTDVEAVMGIVPQERPTPVVADEPGDDPGYTPGDEPSYTPSYTPSDGPSYNPQPQPSPTPTPDPQPQPAPEPEPDPQQQPGDDPSSNQQPQPGDNPSSSPQAQPGDGPDGYNKQPSDGPSVKPGEPDVNTNNPSDPDHSTADRPDNSTSLPSYDDYDQWADEMQDINDNQQVGGDPNTPSTPTPPDTTVDSNADTGTGNGGIDTPTPVTEPAHEADTGEAINSKPGEAWGGPKD